MKVIWSSRAPITLHTIGNFASVVTWERGRRGNRVPVVYWYYHTVRIRFRNVQYFKIARQVFSGQIARDTRETSKARATRAFKPTLGKTTTTVDWSSVPHSEHQHHHAVSPNEQEAGDSVCITDDSWNSRPSQVFRSSHPVWHRQNHFRRIPGTQQGQKRENREDCL